MLRFATSALVLALSLTACVPKQPPLTRCKGYSIDSADISKIVIDYGRKLQDSHRLFLYDSRVIMDGKIKKIRLDFTSMASEDLCDARKVLVDVVEGYVQRFREHSVLSGNFFSRPVSARDLEVHITYTSYFNSMVDSGYVAYIILEDGWSYFYNSELNEPFADGWMQKAEPYFQTRQFVGFKDESEEVYKEALEKEIKAHQLEDDRYYEENKNQTS